MVLNAEEKAERTVAPSKNGKKRASVVKTIRKSSNQNQSE
jgi:hypothetical protein